MDYEALKDKFLSARTETERVEVAQELDTFIADLFAQIEDYKEANALLFVNTNTAEDEEVLEDEEMDVEDILKLEIEEEY